MVRPWTIPDNSRVAIHYRIDAVSGLVIAAAVGCVSDADLLSYAHRLLRDPDRGRAKHELVDLRAASPDSTAGSEGVRELAGFWSRHRDEIAGGRLAIIAPGDAAYGMSRMYQNLRSDGPDFIRVFRDPAEALEWLGADPGLSLEVPADS